MIDLIMMQELMIHDTPETVHSVARGGVQVFTLYRGQGGKIQRSIAKVKAGDQSFARESVGSDKTGFFNLEATGKPGQLVEVGPTKKIFENPDKKETEDYISGRFG